ncbi:hypothetical protein NP233_g1777 [Leucocoprinus birnbaumii]|uniref:Wax synthase domain-containing protein n=1 Tax=Leucocoprinus birnbaumii TaxID=56174 RepID=A0AAD5YVH2_9AGAR|nr:hypothetical protein NP233_g1777 [Leucocoprinus birnbaumii]
MPHPRPISPLFLPLFFLHGSLIVLGFASRPSPYRPLLFLPVAFVAYYTVSLSRVCSITTVPPVDFAAGAWLLVQTISSFNGMVLYDAQKTLYRVVDTPGQITTEPFVERVRWGFDLFMNLRGIGWNHEPRRLPRNPQSLNESRAAFVISRFWTLGELGLVIVALRLVFGDPNTTSDSSRRLHIEILSRLLPLVSLALVGTIVHSISSVAAVGFGISKPAAWPPGIGKFADAYTVGNCWGLVWHQGVRVHLVTLAQFILHDIFKVPSKPTYMFRFLSLHIVFFLSGLIHVGFEFMAHGQASSEFIVLFMLQAWAITAEQAVQYIAFGSVSRIEAPSFWWRLIGYVWVGCWVIACAPLAEGVVRKVD